MSQTAPQGTPQIISEEAKNIALGKEAKVKIYNINLMAQIIDLAMQRGAFRGTEASKVGALFDILSVAIKKACDLAEEELKNKSPTDASNATDHI